MDPQPREWILDMCAAPGGKTIHIAQISPTVSPLKSLIPRPASSRLTVQSPRSRNSNLNYKHSISTTYMPLESMRLNFLKG